MDCSMPGFPVHHHLPELAQTHVHWVSDAIQPSHPLWSPSPPAFNLSQHQGLFQWVRKPKYWNFSFRIVLPMNIQGWFPLGLTGLISCTLRASQESTPTLQFKSINLQCSAFFMVQLSHPYIPACKTISLTIWTFVSKVMSQAFNTLYRLVIAFLPRSRHLLIS